MFLASSVVANYWWLVGGKKWEPEFSLEHNGECVVGESVALHFSIVVLEGEACVWVHE